MGLKPHEFDFSWFVLKCLQKVGLVYTINESMRADKTNELAIAEDADEAMRKFENENKANKANSEKASAIAAEAVGAHRSHKPVRAAARVRTRQ